MIDWEGNLLTAYKGINTETQNKKAWLIHPLMYHIFALISTLTYYCGYSEFWITNIHKWRNRMNIISKSKEQLFCLLADVYPLCCQYLPAFYKAGHWVLQRILNVTEEKQMKTDGKTENGHQMHFASLHKLYYIFTSIIQSFLIMLIKVWYDINILNLSGISYLNK